MSIGRILKHWVMSPVPVTLAFPQSSLDAVTKCIEECEQQTSAEFRLIIERSIPSKGLRENITDAQRAKELFGRYGVWDTEDNNTYLSKSSSPSHMAFLSFSEMIYSPFGHASPFQTRSGSSYRTACAASPQKS